MFPGVTSQDPHLVLGPKKEAFSFLLVHLTPSGLANCHCIHYMESPTLPFDWHTYIWPWLILKSVFLPLNWSQNPTNLYRSSLYICTRKYTNIISFGFAGIILKCFIFLFAHKFYYFLHCSIMVEPIIVLFAFLCTLIRDIGQLNCHRNRHFPLSSYVR